MILSEERYKLTGRENSIAMVKELIVSRLNRVISIKALKHGKDKN